MEGAETMLQGRRLDGYRLLRLLGESGGGRVFLASQASTGQLVALKLLRQPAEGAGGDGARRIARFEREIRLCARLHHPHIVRLLDKGQGADGQLYAAFEYVPGETLKELLVRKGALSAPEAGQLLAQVLDALACAHAQGIVHRDLKPHNIMVTSTGTRAHAKVLDFGIATLLPERHRIDHRHATLLEEALCSPSYSAPEQLRGEPPSARTDLYAWGLVLLECLTGRPAIDGATLAEVYHKQLSALEVPLPPALLGHPLGALLRRVLRKAPAERAERADALLADFQRLNLAAIDGDLRPAAAAARAAGGADDLPTAPYQAGWSSPAYERRQLTVLCCSLALSGHEGAALELEAMEALQRDQLGQCIDTAARFGGHLAGNLGNGMMFYFGYPCASDDDARRCARAALELAGQARRRRPALLRQYGIAIDISIGIHTGMVLVADGYLPGGVTPNTAQQLERLGAPGEVLVSAAARRLFDAYLEFDDAGGRVLTGIGGPMPYFRAAGESRAEALSYRRTDAPARPLVGREQELARLARAWEAAARHAGAAVLVSGQPGIGKSRLLHELRAIAGRQAHAVRECRCLSEHRSDALHPFLELLRAQLQLAGEGDAAAACARLRGALAGAGHAHDAGLAIMCSWLGLPLPPDAAPLQLSPQRQKDLLLAALAGLILRMGGGAPLLLVVEDIHWIDQTSAELLARLAQAAPAHALLLVATSRGADALPSGAPAFERIALGRLAPSDARALIGELARGQRIDDDTLRRLCGRTDGIPLFIEEFVRMLLDDGVLAERDGVLRLDERFDHGQVPATLRDLLGARLARLGAARETAQLAAAIGREFDHALLAEVALADEASVQSDLERLLAADLIYRRRRVDGDSYVFRHALILDAAYDALSLPVRAQTHARIAQRLSQAAPEQVERSLAQLARHFSLAREFGDAVRYGMRATFAALQRALYDDAIALARRVDGWIAQLPEPQRQAPRIDTCALLTQALMAKHGWADAAVRENVELSLRLIGESGDARRTVPALWTMAVYHHVAGNRAEVRALSARLMDLSAQAADRGLGVACRTMLGMSHWIDGAYGDAAGAFDTVLAHYDALAHADHGNLFGLDSRVWSMAALACVRWFAGSDDAAAFELACDAVACAETLGHIPSLGIALMYQAYVHQYAGDRAGTGRVCAQLLALADQHGLPAVEGYAAILMCWVKADLEAAERVYAALQGLGCMLGATYTGALLADIAAGRGDHAGAVARLDACLALGERLGERYYEPELLLRRAQSRAAMADPDARLIERDLRAAAAIAQARGMLRSAHGARVALEGMVLCSS